MKYRGFTLIELIVVIAIIALVLVVALPGFSNFNKSQLLKTSAAELKSFLREAQNASLVGKKGSCGDDDILFGHYAAFAESSSYEIKLQCGIVSVKKYLVKKTTLPSGVTVDAKWYLSKDMVRSAKVDSVTVVFRPVNAGVELYDGYEVFTSPKDIGGLEIILTNGSESYSVTVTSSGDIYDKKL